MTDQPVFFLKRIALIGAACWGLTAGGAAWAQAPGGGVPTGRTTELGAPAAGRAAEAMNPFNGAASAQGLPAGVPAGLPPQFNALGANASLLNNAAQVGAGAQMQNQPSDLGQAPILAPTQFQKFVQEATGKLLPLYGYNLFDRGRFPSVTDVPVPANYVVGPGDELDIKVWGALDLALRLPVDREGQITIPRVGPVSVAGIKLADLDAHLKRRVGRVFTNFELSASVGKLRSVQVFVVGAARNPGAYTVSSLSTLVGAIFQSGGPAVTGSMRNIDLIRAGSKVASMDLYRFMLSGDLSADVRLLPGDVIVYAPSGPRVALTGAVDNQFVFELAGPEETLGQILRYSASSTILSTPSKVLVERIDNQKTKGPREIQERTLDEAGLKSTVRDGDLITLLKISPRFANAVTLRGNVAAPLRYAFKPGMRISDLIPEAEALILNDYYAKKNILVQYEGPARSSEGPARSSEGPARSSEGSANVSLDRAVGEARSRLPEINWEYASIERANRAEVTSRLIPFNLGRAVKNKDPAHNLELEPGDVVTVFGINDIPLPQERRPQYVKISGEVNAPGIYQVQPGETLAALVRKAGGLSANAFPYASVFTRESTRLQQQSNLDQAVRRLEAQINSQATTLTQGSEEPEKARALQAQVLMQKQNLERLRVLKSSGRMALELDPSTRALPDLPLEDGDAISIPARPSFVSVFGAVLAESTFLHRPGATVADILERAGPTRDADMDAVMLLRADGSVVANKALRSWWGRGGKDFMATRIHPGDSILVPELLDKRTPYAQFVQGAKDWTQLLYQFGLGAAAFKTLTN